MGEDDIPPGILTEYNARGNKFAHRRAAELLLGSSVPGYLNAASFLGKAAVWIPPVIALAALVPLSWDYCPVFCSALLRLDNPRHVTSFQVLLTEVTIFPFQFQEHLTALSNLVYRLLSPSAGRGIPRI